MEMVSPPPLDDFPPDTLLEKFKTQKEKSFVSPSQETKTSNEDSKDKLNEFASLFENISQQKEDYPDDLKIERIA